jgi:hypothetical protein
MNRDGKRPVSLEDLLRLKRAERPAESFWADFDRQLRAKQLAALVEKRPWWQAFSLGGLVSGLRRHPVPLGAAVALGFGFFLVRDGRHSVASQPVAAVAPVTVMVSSPVALASVVESAPAPRSINPAPAASFVAATVPARAPEIASEVATVPASIEAAQTAFVTPEAESSRSLFVGTVPLSLEAQSSLFVSSADPVTSAPFLGGGTRVEARAPASRLTVEPLRQITPPADRRGSRILTAMVSMSSVENAMRTTERAASRLSEEQLYDQIRRVGAVGAAVNVKF